uniref:Secreted protein n=1 Tax=Sinocyclocheilus rhinocerous TaxID=307959 RepID=A0A673J828_9TELE
MLSRVCNYLVVSIVCFALLWRCSIGGPVGARESPLRLTGTCNELARSLLWNVSAVLEIDHLFSGFDCSQQNAEVHLRRQTVSACTPQVREESHTKIICDSGPQNQS